MIRVEIIADRKSTAEDLARLLAFEDHIEIVAAHAIEDRAAASGQADVLLAVKLLSTQIPRRTARVVALSEDHIERVHASLPFQSSPAAISAAIIAAAAGLYTLTPDQMHVSNGQGRETALTEKLTGRELDVLNLLSEGLSNKEIAGALRISTHTAKFHVAQVLAKLSVSTRTEAVRIGLRRGLIAL